MFENILDDDLVDINIDEKSIRDAIDKLNTNSAQGPDGVPAVLMIKTRHHCITTKINSKEKPRRR